MKVYIVRHGQTTTNALGYHQLEDDDLTELGIKQAEELRDKIKDKKFDIIHGKVSKIYRSRSRVKSVWQSHVSVTKIFSQL